MSKSDYYRPSEAQIENHYRCTRCGTETSVPSCYGGPETCYCGGAMQYAGESYPASADDWTEERGPDGEWRERW